jgi:hypothetical protein
LKGFLVIGLFICSTAIAGWTELTNGAVKASIGDNKVAKVDQVVLFWQRVEIKDKQSPIDLLLMRVMASCESNHYSVINQISYKDGKEAYQNDKPSEPKPINRGSLLSVSLEHLCGVSASEVILNGELY